MLYNGVMIAQASGRLDGSVWSHNRGGPYVRELGNPNPNPATDEQTASRRAMADVIVTWRSLSPAQRRAWEDYSRDFPTTSRIGVVRPAGGLPLFTRANITRIQQNLFPALTSLDYVLDPPDDGPLTPDPDQLTDVAFTDDHTVFVAVDAGGPYWQDNGGVCVWYSPILVPTVNFYKTPMTLGAWLCQRTDTGGSIVLPVPLANSGDRIRLRFRVFFDDGNITRDWWSDLIWP